MRHSWQSTSQVLFLDSYLADWSMGYQEMYLLSFTAYILVSYTREFSGWKSRNSENNEWFSTGNKAPNKGLGEGVESKIENPIWKPHNPTSNLEG